MEPSTSGGRVGRPRDAALDEAIIAATRRRLAQDGYPRTRLSDIAADAGVTRPTVYRRWRGKLELVLEALARGFRAEAACYPSGDVTDVEGRDALRSAIRRLDPRYVDPDAIVLIGNCIGEARRSPELLAIVREDAVEPRLMLLENVLRRLQADGRARDDIDVRAIATLCYGAYFGAFLRGDEDADTVVERVLSTLWPMIAPARTDRE